MFIGDRGCGVGSTIKGYDRQGGTWKAKKHSLYTPVCITNEHNTSQTCIYCFKKLFHPIRTVTSASGKKSRSINGAFVCYNNTCLSVKAGQAVHGRDALSSIAIGFSGLAMLLFGLTFPAFSTQASHCYTEQFKRKAVAFLNRTATRPTAGGASY